MALSPLWHLLVVAQYIFSMWELLTIADSETVLCHRKLPFQKADGRWQGLVSLELVTCFHLVQI